VVGSFERGTTVPKFEERQSQIIREESESKEVEKLDQSCTRWGKITMPDPKWGRRKHKRVVVTWATGTLSSGSKFFVKR